MLKSLVNSGTSIQDVSKRWDEWRPFASMPEQYIGLQEVINKQLEVPQPLLTEEQMEQINFTFTICGNLIGVNWKRVINIEEKEQQEIHLTKVYDYAEYPDKVLSRPKSKKVIENKG